MPMFHRHDPQDSQDHFQENNTPHYYQNAASYRSYEEVLAQKRRRARLRRGCAVCAILVAVGGAAILTKSLPDRPRPIFPRKTASPLF